MNVLVTLPQSRVGSRYFPTELVDRVESLDDVTVTWNDTDEQLTAEALQERLPSTDVLVTHWGSPRLTEEVLAGADASRLELVAHVGGSVAPIVSDAVYDRGITVCSAVRTMAPFVAETTLALAQAALRDVPGVDAAIRDDEWPRDVERYDTLFEARVGLVGLGSVGAELLDLLAPFDVEVRVYDPYVDPGQLADYEFAEATDLDDALQSDVVSVHAAKTEETLHMLDADRLARLPDGALLVNTARGAVVDEAALVDELRSGRIRAALDVYEEEPLPDGHPLKELDNVVLSPHVGGTLTGHRMAVAMVEEIERLAAGESLEHEIPRAKYKTMTRSWLSAEDA